MVSLTLEPEGGTLNSGVQRAIWTRELGGYMYYYQAPMLPRVGP